MEIREAIEIINQYDMNFHWNDGEPIPVKQLMDAFDLAISALEKQEQDRWIPVTEKLPEDEYVLISKKPTKLSGSKWNVGIGIRTADQRSRKIQWRDSGFGIIQDDKVLAWKPLPEPYTEEEA